MFFIFVNELFGYLGSLALGYGAVYLLYKLVLGSTIIEEEEEE